MRLELSSCGVLRDRARIAASVAGGIVRTAHIPTYRKLEYPIAGVYDIRRDAALDTAAAFGIGVIFSSIDKAVSLARCLISPCRAIRF